MGYGLYYRTDAQSAQQANEWLQTQDEYHTLKSYGYKIHFWSREDLEDENKENIMNYDIGEGYNSLSVSLAHNAQEVIGRWSDLFYNAYLNASFELYVLSSSCSLVAKNAYFTEDELRKVTGDGECLTGDKIEEVRGRW